MLTAFRGPKPYHGPSCSSNQIGRKVQFACPAPPVGARNLDISAHLLRPPVGLW